MKNSKYQRTTMVLGIALALGLATLSAGCTPDNNDASNTAMNADGSAAAGAGNSTQPVSDTLITTKVKAALATTGGVNNTDVGVETNNGVVTLTGTASSATSVDAMKAAAMRVDGVSSVNTMGLQVGGAMANGMNNGVNDDATEGDGYAENDESMDAATQNSDAPVKDTWITTKVLAKLQTVDGLDNTDIAVETSNGIVTLSGRADSQAMIDAAVTAAKSIQGVKEVKTSLLKVGDDADR